MTSNTESEADKHLPVIMLATLPALSVSYIPVDIIIETLFGSLSNIRKQLADCVAGARSLCNTSNPKRSLLTLQARITRQAV